MRRISAIVLLCASMFVLGLADEARAQQVECRSTASTVKAVTAPDYHPVTTKFQLDTPNLQPLLTTTVFVTGLGASCIIAHFSAMARITDNYVVFQVRVDGEPMEGHLSGVPGVATPVIFTALDDNVAEQFTDPTKVVAYNFFKRVRPGLHTIEVMVAAGSNIDPANPPQIGSPVLTLEYR